MSVVGDVEMASLGIQFAKIEIDNHLIPETVFETFVQKELCMPTSVQLPMLLIDGKYQCGLEELKRAEREENLEFLSELMAHTKEDRSRVKSASPLFWFPDSANSRQVSASCICYIIYAILCIAFHKQRNSDFAVLALAIDLVGYSLYGSSVSLGGVLGSALTTMALPDYIPGTEKQADVFVDTAFAVFSAGLYLSDYRAGGAAVLGCLLGVFLLESVGYGLGTFIYKQLRYIGWARVETVRGLMRLKFDRLWVWQRTYNAHWIWKFSKVEKLSFKDPVIEHALLPGANQVIPTNIDVIRKIRHRDFKTYDYGMIRFSRVENFLLPTALAALAYAYKLVTGDTLINDRGEKLITLEKGPRGVANALVITSVILFCVLAILLTLKFILYPKKAWKEWHHPVSGNLFHCLSICVTVYGSFMYQQDRHFGIGIIWIASVFQMCLSVSTFASFVFTHHSEETINASLLLIPIGNFFCTLALGQYPFDSATNETVITQFDVNYVFIARFWFSVGTLFSLVLFTITLFKSLRDAHADPRRRPTLWTWQAAASIAGPAYYTIAGNGVAMGKTFAYQSLWLIALVFFALNCYGWITRFFTFCEDMSIWHMAFATSCGAISTVHYFAFVSNDRVTEILVYFALAIASASCAICFLYSFSWVIDGSMFKPKAKWGPATFLTITNEAFHEAARRLKRSIANLDEEKPYTFPVLIEQVQPMFVSYRAHMELENRVIFPACRAQFPGLNPALDRAPDQYQLEMVNFVDKVDVLKQHLYYLKAGESIDPDAVVRSIEMIKEELVLFLDEKMLFSLRNAEETMTVMLRKHCSIERQKEVTRAAYDATHADNWQVIIPFVVKYALHPEWKLQYIRSFLWAMPERAQEIGLILYRGLDSVAFADIAQQIPEIIPRGLHGYVRKY